MPPGRNAVHRTRRVFYGLISAQQMTTMPLLAADRLTPERVASNDHLAMARSPGRVRALRSQRQGPPSAGGACDTPAAPEDHRRRHAIGRVPGLARPAARLHRCHASSSSLSCPPPPISLYSPSFLSFALRVLCRQIASPLPSTNGRTCNACSKLGHAILLSLRWPLPPPWRGRTCTARCYRLLRDGLECVELMEPAGGTLTSGQ